ncbi:MAG: TrpR like protein, YerC/YecD [Parcubacteria group bacterium LiPW_41]|nr:MAG: TrpR like protein, YerC/YecD [Parcubacteria group bacterium LiPW_41]
MLYLTKALYFDTLAHMQWKDAENTRLIQAVLALKTPDEAQRFLRDLMTEKEIKEFSNRFKTAELLTKNVPYSEIEQKTGLSSRTVARVSKWLNGKGGGYRTIINRLHSHNSIQARKGLS